MIKHMSLNFLCRRLPWLWSGSHTSRLAQLLCIVLVVRVMEATSVSRLFVRFCLRAETRPPERIASHDYHQPFGIGDRSVVSGFYSCPFLFADFLTAVFNILLALSGGSNDIVRSHPPSVGVNSIFCLVLGSKLKPCLYGPTQIHRPQSVISVTAIKGRRQFTFLVSMGSGFPVPSQVHRILFPWSYTLSLPAVLYAHPSREPL